MKRRFARLVVLLAGVPLVIAAGGCGVVRNLWPHTYATSLSPNGLHTASVWRATSLDPPDDHLFLATRGGPTRRLMDLAPDADWCRTIIWTPDSSKVGFVIADDRLALFDVRTGTLEAFFFLAGTGCCGGPLESRNVVFNEEGTEVSFDRFERATVSIATGDGRQFEAPVTRESMDGPTSRRPLLRPARNLGREVVRVPVSQIRIRLLAPSSRSLPQRVAVRVVEANGRRIEVVGTPAADGLVVLPATYDGPLDRLELGFSDGTGKRTLVRGVKSGEGEIVVKVPSAPAG